LGGQTGTEERRGTGTAGGNGCLEEPRELGLDELSQLGFSAREAMSAALGTRTVPLVWQAGDASFSFGPEMGPATLGLTLSSSATSARFVHYARDSGSNEQSAIGCPPDDVQIAVKVVIETSGGALSEEFPAALRAVSVASSKFAVELPLGALNGSFVVTPASGFSTRTLAISVELDAEGLRGAVTGLLEQSSGAVASARPITYACFPAGTANCLLP
jgi:hypothetical protein